MIIRSETTPDISAITEITQKAFESHPVSRQTEHFIIKALRKAGALTLSLVAEVDGRVVGHIAFSPLVISDGSRDWYGVGPLAVLPELQRQGIGKALIREGLSILKEMGGKGVVLVGDPGYYKPLGFRNDPELVYEGIPQEYVLAMEFGEQRARGVVAFHPAFGATE